MALKMMFMACFMIFYQISPVLSGDIIEPGANGQINWTDGIVYAEGMGPVEEALLNNPRGKLIARRIAIVDCQRNLLEMVKGVRVTSVTMVRDLMVEKDIVMTSISGIIKNAEIVKERFDETDKIFYITMKMPFSGKFMDTVVDDKMLSTQRSDLFKPFQLSALWGGFFMSNAWAADTASIDFDSSEKETLDKVLRLFQQSGSEVGINRLKQVIADFEKFDLFSGVVINALNATGFRPAICARLRKTDGKVVYPGDFLDLKKVNSSLLYSWNDNLEEAKTTKRVTDRPLIIHAQSIYKQQRSDLIVSDKDAESIILMAQGGEVLKRCRVVIVTK